MDDIKALKAELEALKQQVGGLPAVKEAAQLQISREERRQKAARLQELKRLRPQKMECLHEEYREAEENLREAREALKTALGEFRVIDGRLFSEAWQIDQGIRVLESELYRSASVDLQRALEHAKNKLEEARSRPLDHVVMPDIPSGVGVPFYDLQTGDERVSTGGPLSWWRKLVGKTPREERLSEMEEITQEIQQIEQQILGGD
jgi:hypothetical protein